MPALITRGAMSARAYGFAGGAGGGSFIGGTFIANNGGGGPSVAVSFPANSAIGDIAFITVWEGSGDTVSITGGAGGWTRYRLSWGPNYTSSVFVKALASADLAGVTVTAENIAVDAGLPIIADVYRGATTATLKSTGAAQTTSLALTGFTKALLSKGLVSILSATTKTVTPAYPSAFTARTGGPSSFFSVFSTDLLNAPVYVNGSAVTWSGFSAGTYLGGYLFELT